MIVNLYDSRALRGDWQYTTPRDGSLRVVAGSHESLADIISRVILEIKWKQSIKLLRILSHGNHGWIQMGTDNINIANARQFSELSDYFNSNGVGVAIHSCGSASDTTLCRDPSLMESIRARSQGVEDTCLLPLGPGTLSIGRGRGVLSRQGIINAHVMPITGGGRGVDFLQEISYACKMAVRGAINSQTPDGSFRFEGLSIAVLKHDQAVVVPDRGQLAFDTTPIFI